MTVHPAFNLLDEPWIPVRTQTGEVLEVSLADALLKARDYAALAETSPPNLIALYRLLLAALHRALTTQHGQWRDADRARWFRESLPEAPIRAYLEHWRERFWLFHPKEPFMQVAALKDAVETRDTATMRPWPQLTLDFVSGNAPVLFDHCVDKHPTGVSSSIALRHLLGYLQFAPGGTVQRFRFRDESGPLDNVAAVLPVGKSLHQTLCLSLHAWSRNSENDLPAWEMDQLRAEQLRVVGATLPSGEVDLFTRLTRSVLLAPVVEGEDGRIVVKRIRFGAGLTLNTHDASFPDPMAAYRKRADNRISPVTFKDGRAFWRDLPAILPSGKGTYHHPAVLDRALICSQSTGSDENINFFVMGTASDPVKCKVFRWRTESLELPKVLLADPDASYSMRLEVSFAEELYARLQGVLASLIAESMPKQKDAKALSRTILANGPAASTFFSAAERALPKLMQQIAAGNFDAAGMDWKTVLADAAKQTWTATRRSLGDSPAVLRADARTWPRFTGLLNTLVPPTQKLETTPEEVTP